MWLLSIYMHPHEYNKNIIIGEKLSMVAKSYLFWNLRWALLSLQPTRSKTLINQRSTEYYALSLMDLGIKKCSISTKPLNFLLMCQG